MLLSAEPLEQRPRVKVLPLTFTGGGDAQDPDRGTAEVRARPVAAVAVEVRALDA